MKKIVFLLVLFSLLSSSSGVALAQTNVTTPSELQAMQSDLSGDYILMNEIDMSGFAFSPIGNDSTPFSGTFDGNGHTISNLNINRPDDPYIGLFGYTAAGARVDNVTLTNFNIVSSGNGGGIAGWNKGAISNVSVSGNISGRSNIGTVAGRNYGSTTNAHGSGNVTITSSTGLQVGGLVGVNEGGYIADSSFDGDVVGALKAGGFVGSNRNGGFIERSYNTGSISNSQLTVLRSMGRLGGFAGQNIYGSTIRDSYSHANVINKRDTTGGFVGFNYSSSSITNSYSSGDVWGLNGYGIGGFVGQSSGSISVASFWDMDTQTHGVTTSAGGTGLSTAAMQTEVTFASAGWDLAGIWAMADYPQFQWQALAQTTLEFFDDAAAAGTLVGVGPGNSAENHLKALRNMIVEAAVLENDGDICGAYEQLEAAYKKVDGESPPKEFASGPAAATLADMIKAKMAGLDC